MRRRSNVRRQGGFALIAVMVLGAVAMLGVASLLGEGTVAERRAQEVELLKLRAYWAAQGHVSYALSRVGQGPPCGGSCANPAARFKYVDDVLDELHDAGAERSWDYPEISAAYAFPVVAIGKNTAPAVRVEVSYPAAASTVPVIADSWPVRRDFNAFVCINLPNVGDSCSTATLDGASGIGHVVRYEPQ